MAEAEYLTGPWWNELIRDWFRETDPIIEELARKVIGPGYIVGAKAPTWDDLVRMADARGPAYAAEFLRRMLANPTTAQDAAKLVRQVRGE